MDFTYGRFAPDAIRIIQEIADSHFVAFDLEFSGVAGHSQRRVAGKPTLQEHYEEIKAAAAKYQILQVGLTIVSEDVENGQYVARPYNFNISPLPALRERTFVRDWSMSSGAVQFLLKNRFDFSQPFLSGVPYLSRGEELKARMNMSGETDRKRPDMILKAEDEVLVQHIRKSITKWQELPEENKEGFLNIPNDDRGKGVPGALNRYQVRLTHQTVQNEFPHLKTISLQNFVQITNPSKEERERHKVLQQEHINREIGRAVGFRWILEAISGRDISGMPDECFMAAIPQFQQAQGNLTPYHAFVEDLNQRLNKRRRVLVGHNCFTDLVYLHQFFLGELPDTVVEFQDSIHELFPAVIDTKSVASFGSGRWGDTSLAAVEEEVRNEPEPKIVVPPDLNRYVGDEKPHEAGYDALLTANIAIKLSTRMEREGKYLEQDQIKPEPSTVLERTELFGTRDDGYVTASEHLDGQSPDSLRSEPDSLKTPTAIQDDMNTSKMPESDAENSANIKPDQILQPPPTVTNFTINSNNVVTVKGKKPKPVNWNSAAEVGKVKSMFAAPNMYDLLENNKDTASNGGQEDLMSFSDPDSPTEVRGMSGPDITEMVKQGKLMPRWDGGNGFWQVFGNKLQVNSCKEGVCNL